MSDELFDNTVAAYAQVKQTAANLQREHDHVCAEIDQAETELKVLPLAPVPFLDLKAAILELIDASGKIYAEQYLKTALASFAVGGSSGVSSAHQGIEFGKPLRYVDLERAVSGADPANARAQLCHPEKNQLNDQVFYFFFADLVKAGLSRVMASMTPAEFGYDKIHPDKIGTARTDRRAAIDNLENRLSTLRDRRDDIEQKLSAIGFPVTRIPARKG